MSNFNCILALTGRDALLRCPYHKHHLVKAVSMSTHMAKCKKQFPNPNLAECRFNSIHVVPKEELEAHEFGCDDRVNYENFFENQNEVKIEKKTKQLPGFGEDWDDFVPTSYDPSKRDINQD